MSVGVHRSFVWESVIVCCLQVSLAWKTISCQTEKENRVKIKQIWHGNCVEDGQHLVNNDINLYIFYSYKKWIGVTPTDYYTNVLLWGYFDDRKMHGEKQIHSSTCNKYWFSFLFQ